MHITLADVGKRFQVDWIFRKLSTQLVSGRSYAILGPNGSGKSTLLQVIPGHLSPTEGKLTYTSANGKPLDPDNIYKQVSIAAPYLELIEEFTLAELVQFHVRLKPLRNNLTPEALIWLMDLQAAAHKPIGNFSSGMRQRVKLALAIYSEGDLLLLDEPATNLDAAGIAWYLEHVQANLANRIVVVCSNSEQEYSFCDEQIRIMDYKKR